MILREKITVPGLPRMLLVRPRLLAPLDRSARLLMITGPAGFGKTTLLLQYVQMVQDADELHAARRVAWYTLDEGDADPAEFVRYLVASLAILDSTIDTVLAPVIDLTIQHATSNPQVGSSTYHQCARAIAQAVNERLPATTLVLDDVHALEQRAIHPLEQRAIHPLIDTIINVMLRYCPHLQLVMASRGDIRFQNCTDLLVHGHAVGLNGTLLAFTSTEVAELVQQHPGASYPMLGKQVVALAQGWPAALVLALSTPHLPPISEADQREVLYRYLAIQVIDDLPPEIRRFVMEMAVFDYVTVERCNQLRAATDSHVFLHEVLRRNIFFTSAGEQSYRFHPLFREFILHRLRRDPAAYRSVLVAASRVAQSERRWDWLIDQAYQAQLWDLLQEWLDQAGEELRLAGRHLTLLTWLRSVPDWTRRPTTQKFYAFLCIEGGAYAEAHQLLDHLRVQGPLQCEIDMMRARLAYAEGQYDAMEAFIAPYLADPDLPAAQRAALLQLESGRLIRIGNAAAAMRCVQEGLTLIQDDDENMTSLLAAAGRCATDLGELEQALSYYQAALGVRGHRNQLILVCVLQNNIADVLRKLGRLDEATPLLHGVLEQIAQYGLHYYESLARATLADVYVAHGRLLDAEAAYATAAQATQAINATWLWQYALAGQLHAARLVGDRPKVATLLATLDTIVPLGPIHEARLATARAAGRWFLRQPDALHAMEQAYGTRAHLDPADQALVLLLAAQLYHAMGQFDVSRQMVDQLGGLDPRMLDRSTLRQWLQAYPQLVEMDVRTQRAIETLILDSPTQVSIQSSLDRSADHAPLSIQTLGQICIKRNGHTVPSDRLSRAHLVFFALLAAGDHGLSEEALRDRVYGLDDHGGLAQAITRCRQQLCPVQRQAGRYRLVLPTGTVYDVALFQAAVQRPTTREQLAQAVALYQGPYLPGVDLPWVLLLREQVQHHYIAALVALAQSWETSDETLALNYYEQAYALAPGHRDVAAGLIHMLMKAGYQLRATEVYHAYAHLCVNDFGIDPDPLVQHAYQRIFA